MVLVTWLVSGCAIRDSAHYQNAYLRYDVPQALVTRIDGKFAENGLQGASVARDPTGRVQLLGTYADEDAVERAFIIVQSIVGLKSTSPAYPDNVKLKRWELAASRAMIDFTRPRATIAAAPQRRALVVGINRYIDGVHLPPIQGEDDARLVSDQLGRVGYRVTSLFGAQATKQAIEAAIARMSDELGPDDILFIYVSSHGAQPVPSPQGGDDRRMSIIAYDSGDIDGHHERDNTDYALRLQATSVRDTLVQSLAQRPSLVTRVFIDTCYSGEILRDVQEDSRSYILATNGGQVERAAVSMSAWSGQPYASKGIRQVADSGAVAATPPSAALVGRERSGYTIITATSEGQESLGPAAEVGVFPSPLHSNRLLRGSFFTQSFFEYLAQHDGQVDEAFDDARNFTEQKALAVSDGKSRQVPRQYSTIRPADDNLYR